MTVVRKFYAKTRLTSLIRQPGGLHAGEAIRRAEAGLAERREAYLGHIDDALARIEGLVATPGYDPEEVYAVATDIVGFCSVFTEDSLTRAALSLCELIDLASEQGPLEQSSVMVHLASMRLLHRTDASTEARAAILSGLAKVVEKAEAQRH